MSTKKPTYLADRLIPDERSGRITRHLRVPNLRLNTSHEGYINQASRLVNMLPSAVIDEQNPVKQKALLRQWIKCNIIVKP